MSTTENAAVEDGTGQQVLDEMNEVFLAEITKFSSPTPPDNPEPYQNWVNTSVNPARWMLRNAENDAFIRIADILNSPTNQIRFFSDGAAVAAAAVANIFLQPQTVDVSGSAGEVSIGTDLQAGVAALLRMFAHNDNDDDFDGLRLQMTVTDATENSEAVSIILQNMQAGTLTTLITMAAAVMTITGTLNATTLQQSGTSVSALIDDAIDSLDTSRTEGGAFTLAQSDAGGAVKFTGGSNQDVTCGRLALDSVIVIHNRGTGDLTLVSDAGPDDVVFENGITIGAGRTATLIMIDTGANQADNVWRVLGENT